MHRAQCTLVGTVQTTNNSVSVRILFNFENGNRSLHVSYNSEASYFLKIPDDESRNSSVYIRAVRFSFRETFRVFLARASRTLGYVPLFPCFTVEIQFSLTRFQRYTKSIITFN